MIDLRSDTVTKPTDTMRAAIAGAEVGDDVYHDDPTVNELEKRVADILGKDDAVFMPTGTMTNQVAIRLHTEPGDVVVTETNSHVDLLEGGGPGALSGVTIRHVAGHHGVFTREALTSVLPPLESSLPASLLQPYRLVCVETTHNEAGGTIWPLSALEAVSSVARDRSMAAHLDGARLWNASVATGIPEADFAAGFDTISVCFSKGLGAPMGSALVGGARHIERARRFKQMIGGGFRQAGMMAAGALYALENNRERLADDHVNARTFAEAAAAMDGITVDLESVQTNMAYIEGHPGAAFAQRCRSEGLLVNDSGRFRVRAVFHLGISSEDTSRAVDALARAVAAST